MNRLATGFLALAAAGTLTACGGGGASFDGDAAISLTGSVAPAETVADQAERSAAIIARTNAITASTLYVEADGKELIALPSCSGTRCTISAELPGISIPFGEMDLKDLLNLGAAPGTRRAVLTKDGITLVESRGTASNPYREYGAWMDHGAFLVRTVRSSDTPVTTLSGALVGGEIAGSRPLASAAWRGVMVGTPARGDSRDDILQGDATLTYDLVSRMLDADFTGIVNLDRNAAHTVGTVSFDNVPVEYDGTFGDGEVGDQIRGAFAGSGYEEVGGVFERHGIVGAFGAMRQPSN
jgi:hypothetical protein